MVVGAAVIDLHVHDAQSLKAKRGVVRSIVARLRNQFNVSVSEVGGQGTWQRATIGLSMSGIDEVAVHRRLARAIEFVEGTHLAQVIDSEIQTLRMPLVVESQANGPREGGDITTEGSTTGDITADDITTDFPTPSFAAWMSERDEE